MRKLAVIAILLALAVTAADARRRGHHYYEREPFARDADSSVPRGDVVGRAIAAMVPRDWTLQPPDPNWNGQRFVAPGGDGWIAIYSTAADGNAPDKHLKAVAFVEGEELMYLHRGRDRLVAAGTKGERHFYRKVVLDCEGRRWQHVALEYPAEAQRALDRFIRQAGRVLEASAMDCGPMARGR